MKKSKVIEVDYLARVEGEGALYIRYDEAGVDDVKLKIFEPPRFFEAFLRGRDHQEVADITSRICGICPVAYQMSAIQAIENALELDVDDNIRALRRLLYCGEWIESHVLHIYMLHAPDFLHYDSAVAMAKDHPQIVARGLQMKKAGNAIVTQIGGREIHPINARVGGFHRTPTHQELQPLREQLIKARDMAIETVRWTAALPCPEFKREPGFAYEFVAMSHPDQYPINEGRIVSSTGLDISPQDYEQYFNELHVEHSSALHSVISGRPEGQNAYLVGPMARFNLNYDTLSALTKSLAEEVGFAPPCTNPFQSIVVRSLEVLYAFDEAIRIIDNYTRPARASTTIPPVAATGYGVTEAPRGLLYHRYDLDTQGKITAAKIVPPTSQNQKTIEDDLRHMIPRFMTLPEDELQALCEQAIRNYDPCISCATHFLKLHVEKH